MFVAIGGPSRIRTLDQLIKRELRKNKRLIIFITYNPHLLRLLCVSIR